ncbi:MAG: hypothetical protein ACJ789_04525 [Thermomicrobiales bacterium]
MDLPSRVHPALAEAAVDGFIQSSGWHRRGAAYGWELRRHGPLTVIAVVPARYFAGERDRFTLRLNCGYYPAHPPDVRFVNPDTLEYDLERDMHHLPQLQAPYCAVHPNYTGFPESYPFAPQLVCSSMSLGYYFSGHSPTVDQLWRVDKHTLGTCIYTVYKALNSEHFQGRYARQGQ